MYSLNAVAPDAVHSLIASSAELLDPFDQHRDRPALVIKRFGDLTPEGTASIQARLNDILTGWAPMHARITGFDVFVSPPGGPAPVIYLSVESPEIEHLHETLVRAFGVVSSDIEGDRFVPHITVARGGDRTAIAPLTDQSVDPIEWTIDEVTLWDAKYELAVHRYGLPNGGDVLSGVF